MTCQHSLLFFFSGCQDIHESIPICITLELNHQTFQFSQIGLANKVMTGSQVRTFTPYCWPVLRSLGVCGSSYNRDYHSSLLPRIDQGRSSGLWSWVQSLAKSQWEVESPVPHIFCPRKWSCTQIFSVPLASKQGNRRENFQKSIFFCFCQRDNDVNSGFLIMCWVLEIYIWNTNSLRHLKGSKVVPTACTAYRIQSNPSGDNGICDNESTKVLIVNFSPFIILLFSTTLQCPSLLCVYIFSPRCFLMNAQFWPTVGKTCSQAN